MRLWWLILLACGGCDLVFRATPESRDGRDAAPTDGVLEDGGPPIDSGPITFAHLPTLVVPTDALRIETPTDIDTNTLTISPPPVVGQPQITGLEQPGGAQLMVIMAGDIQLSSTITVRGIRAVVFVGHTITVAPDAVIDAGADFQVPGPGARLTGAGVGADGVVQGTSSSGAGGGAFDAGAKQGGAAGATACGGIFVGGGGGDENGDAAITLLHGGSPGGGNTQCATEGGGGGGAIQLSAITSIRIAGTIDAGGGGGQGGNSCGGVADGGAGGGSGGAIYLQAPTIDLIAGSVLAANGAGGGGGGCANPAAIGNPGDNATLGLMGARGGVAVASGCGEQGGSGAFGNIIASTGNTVGCDGHAGGGGGSVGRIVLRAGTITMMGTTTPTPTQLAP